MASQWDSQVLAPVPGSVYCRREHLPSSPKREALLASGGVEGKEPLLTGNTLLNKAAFPREGKLLLVPAGGVKVEM